MRPVDPRLLREAPAARRFLIVATVIALVEALAVVMQAVALGLVVARVFLDRRPLEAVGRDLVLFAVATAVRALAAWTFETGGRLTALRVAGDLRSKLLAHLLAAKPAGLRDRSAGEVAAIAVGGLDLLDPYFGRFLPQLVRSAVIPATIFVWVVWHDLTSAIVMALTLPLIPIFGILVGKATQARTLRRLESLTVLSGYFLDVVRGLPTLRAFGRGRSQTANIAAVSDAYRVETMATLRIAFLSAFVLELAATLSTAVIAVEIGVRLVDGRIALAPALAVLVLAPEFYGPLRAAAAEFHAGADGLVAAGRVFALIDLPPDVAQPTRPLPAPDLRSAPIRMERLRLRYPDRVDDALREISTVIEPGDRVAVVGPSGAGKSTLLELLLRLRDPTSGGLFAGDIDAAHADPATWREQIAWLPQRPRLAAGPLRDALDPSRSLRDADLWHALDQASASQVVSALPDGLDAVIGERSPFSAGEIRRLALARALVAPKALLVLDEPTAHLDVATATAVADMLVSLRRDRTLIVATHDEHLFESADRVIRLGARLPAIAAVA